MKKTILVSCILTMIFAVSACRNEIDSKYVGTYYLDSNPRGKSIGIQTDGIVGIYESLDTADLKQSQDRVSFTANIDGTRISLTRSDSNVNQDFLLPEFRVNKAILIIDGDILVTETGKRFVKFNDGMKSQTSSSSNGTNKAATPYPESRTSSTNVLSQDEMHQIMMQKGIWNMYDGGRRYPWVEIIKVGEYNQEGKYYPVRVKIPITDGGKTEIYDCRIMKDDYGEWIVRRIG